VKPDYGDPIKHRSEPLPYYKWYWRDYRANREVQGLNCSSKLVKPRMERERTGKQLDAASRTAPDKYHADRLRFLATGVRDVTLPLCRIASHLQKRGVR